MLFNFEWYKWSKVDTFSRMAIMMNKNYQPVESLYLSGVITFVSKVLYQTFFLWLKRSRCFHGDEKHNAKINAQPQKYRQWKRRSRMKKKPTFVPSSYVSVDFAVRCTSWVVRLPFKTFKKTRSIAMVLYGTSRTRLNEMTKRMNLNET